MISHSYDDHRREVPPLVISADQVMDGVHRGAVLVEAGNLDLCGRIEGSLELNSGTSATISGKVQGSVHVYDGAKATVAGTIEGSAHVAASGVLVIAPAGKLAGSVHNDGSVVVQGVFGGSRSGAGHLKFEGDGYEKQPTIRDGINYYDW